MGLYHTVHIGAAIKIPNLKRGFYSTRRACSCFKHHCSEHIFCPKCGEKIIEEKVKIERQLDGYEIFGDDRFFHHVGSVESEDDTMYLFSNDTHGLISCEENQALQITDSFMSCCISEFVSNHKEDIATIREATGLNKIEVGFFVLHNYS